jgi:hypothetical protein
MNRDRSRPEEHHYPSLQSSCLAHAGRPMNHPANPMPPRLPPPNHHDPHAPATATA